MGQQCNRAKPLKILVTAGATQEPIDPVRFISNRSTGFLGCEIAKAARERGHQVFLISGVLTCRKPPGIPSVDAPTVAQMSKALAHKFSWCDCLLMTAAICDFSPQTVRTNKIKRGAQKELVLKLKQNPDILAGLSKTKGSRLLIGFALETDDLKKNARAKLTQKNTDFIVAVQMKKDQHPFGEHSLDVIVIDKKGQTQKLRNTTKTTLAGLLLDKIEKASLIAD